MILILISSAQWEGVLRSSELPKIWAFLTQLEVDEKAFDMGTEDSPNEILLPRNHIVRNADIHQYGPEIITPEVLEALVNNCIETCLRLKDKGLGSWRYQHSHHILRLCDQLPSPSV